MKYSANLINDSGCSFDNTVSNNLKNVKSWARGRGGNYKLVVCTEASIDYYDVKNNKLMHQYSEGII
jgi:hypothetical protein